MKDGINLNNIGKKIKSIRLSNGLTQIDFAKMICITQAHLSRLETGDASPSKALIRLISLQFDISEDFLTGDSDEFDS